MISSLDIAKTGLGAAALRLAVSAHDVANVNTGGFVPGAVAAEELPQGGVSASVVPGSSPEAQARLDAIDRLTSGTDLVHETEQQILAAAAFRSNLATVRAADEAFQSLLDVVG